MGAGSGQQTHDAAAIVEGYRCGQGGGLLAARRAGGAGMALGDPKLVAAPGLDPVGEDHIRHFVDLGDPNFGNAAIRRQRLGRLAADQVSAMPIHLEADIQLGQRP